MEAIARLQAAWMERTLSGLDWIARHRKAAPAIPAHLLTGTQGEDAAFFYLCRKGYTVVARRWSCSSRPGDLDLVAWDGPMLCIIEVKTRTAHDATPAEVAVDSHKRQTLRKLAHQYVRQLPQELAPPLRFDVISVYLIPGQKKEFQHFEAAFGWSDRPQRG